ncbi:MAG: hypothetical protein A4E51_00073 [Methanosaeta sp. PtaU1.Bin055]|nr:MAG: hypothetical protein A4E51_00073 [Methanosaeta sp. PtaU1.Bin055]
MARSSSAIDSASARAAARISSTVADPLISSTAFTARSTPQERLTAVGLAARMTPAAVLMSSRRAAGSVAADRAAVRATP